jgi:ATP-dependent RNA helicase DeaD
MSSFDDLGLRPELLRALGDEELERPTALQEAVVPALRRGGNLVARASSGSGKTLAYALGVLDRLTPREPVDEEVHLRFLVLVPTQEEAERVALSIFPYAQAVGLNVTVPGGSWGTPAAEAEVVVTPVADIMDAVRSSTTKLDQVEAVVIDGAAAICDLGEAVPLDALLDLVPRDAQRIVLSAGFTAEVEDMVERRVKRALRYPAEPALPDELPTPLVGKIGYVLIAGREKLDVLARQLSGSKGEGGPPPVIFCRTDERAAALAEQLSIRGFVVGGGEDTDADVAVASSETTRAELLEEAEEGLGQTISYDVPADVATLAARHEGDNDAVIMVDARELPHVREVARAASLAIRPLPLPVDGSAGAASLKTFRDRVRRAAQEEDLTAQMLVLAPLFEEIGAAEVAAALATLLRRSPAAPAPRTERAPATPSAPSSSSAETGPAPKPWTRLYVGIGSRDDIRPGDLVGALAGESEIKGAQIGKIEIRDSFSVVEVEAEVADRVIRAVNGTTIKGRSVRVDYDRAGNRPKRPERREGNRPEGKRKIARRPERE